MACDLSRRGLRFVKEIKLHQCYNINEVSLSNQRSVLFVEIST
jgi:hypothetical protein